MHTDRYKLPYFNISGGNSLSSSWAAWCKKQTWFRFYVCNTDVMFILVIVIILTTTTTTIIIIDDDDF